MSDSPTSQTGILLVNLGSPTSPEPRSVAKYLREFLSDPSVIDIPGPLRWALVNLIIAPTRSAKSAAAYKKVWTPKGSPLIVNSFATRDALAERLNRHPLDIGMRYGKPSIAAALERLKTRGCKRIVRPRGRFGVVESHSCTISTAMLNDDTPNFWNHGDPWVDR